MKFKHQKLAIERKIYIQVARVPRLIQLEVGNECERKRTWRDVWKEVGRGVGRVNMRSLEIIITIT